jgi:pyruvate carboxylase
LDQLAEYWRHTREFYAAFESQVLPASGDLYEHEMPGGQYTNLYQQARALGLADRWSEVCKIYADVNQLFGDIVKVTPTSKAVGDMALFMVANELSADEIVDGRQLAYPESVLDLIGGRMGQPVGGFPDEVIKSIMGDREVLDTRPGESLPPADFEKASEEVEQFLERTPTRQDVVTYLLYPKVFQDFSAHQLQYSDTSGLPTPNFFYGLNPGEEVALEIEKGKTLIVKFLTVGEPHPDGSRTVFFELNGQPRDVRILDQSLEPEKKQAIKADPANPNHVAASMPGMVVTVAVQEGDSVKKGQKLLSLEAMKMETTMQAENGAKVAQVLVGPGSQVETGDLLVVLES